MREVAEAMGWDEDDVAEELKNLATNPSEPRCGTVPEVQRTGHWNEDPQVAE
ncbi:MAG: hypothetical protein ACO2OZ_11700 [Acidilobaceae archaeon]